MLSDRIIFLGEEVTDASASTIIAQMLFLEAQDPFYINCPGGSVTAGFAIYDTIAHVKTKEQRDAVETTFTEGEKIIIMENVLSFLRAAAPWISMGLLIAFLCVRPAIRKGKAEDDYAEEGMCEASGIPANRAGSRSRKRICCPAV